MPGPGLRDVGLQPFRLIHWAEGIGPATAQVVRDILERKLHRKWDARLSGILRLERSTRDPGWRPPASEPSNSNLLVSKPKVYSEALARSPRRAQCRDGSRRPSPRRQECASENLFNSEKIYLRRT